MTVKEAYDFAKYHLENEYSKSETSQMVKILFEDLFGLYGPSDKTFSLRNRQELKRCVFSLKDRTPLQYITGKANFYGYDFKVNRNVLIPRPETEELVYWVLQSCKKANSQLDILDIGTGSGCIAVTLKKENPSLRLFAVDISVDALNIAKYNAQQLSAPVHFFNVDILDKEEWKYLGACDIVVSNPPYIPQSEKNMMDKNVLDFEPEMALFVSNEDPLIFYRTILEFSRIHVKYEGWVYFEINEFYAEELRTLAISMGFDKIEIKNDLQGKARMMRMQKNFE